MVILMSNSIGRIALHNCISELHDHFPLFSPIAMLISANSGHFWHLFWVLIPQLVK